MRTALKFCLKMTMVLVCTGIAFGQHPGPPPAGPPPVGHPGDALPPPPDQRPPLRGGPPGRWWDNPEMAKKLDMTADQIKKMDDIFQQVRFKLIDLNGNLRKEEATLDPLMQAERPDDAKLLPQIDRVANARAELEKANARLLLSIRHVLTPEQWKKLQSEDMRPPRPDGQGPPPKREEE
jgi:periplasmic protein CpxP/Spy